MIDNSITSCIERGGKEARESTAALSNETAQILMATIEGSEPFRLQLAAGCGVAVTFSVLMMMRDGGGPSSSIMQVTSKNGYMNTEISPNKHYHPFSYPFWRKTSVQELRLSSGHE